MIRAQHSLDDSNHSPSGARAVRLDDQGRKVVERREGGRKGEGSQGRTAADEVDVLGDLEEVLGC